MKNNPVCTLLLLLLGLSFFTACHSAKEDSYYFNGEILIKEDRVKETVQAQLIPLQFDGAYYGHIAAYDSLIFFFNQKLSNNFYQIFHADTGKEIGEFCPRGQGPEETLSVGPIFQLYKEEGDLKTLIFDVGKGKLFFWNITQSILQKKTVWDKIVPYPWADANGGACYYEMFVQSENTLIAKVAAFPINRGEATLPFIQQRSIDGNECLRNYHSYKESIKNGEASIMAESFFYSFDGFKPDGTKIVHVRDHFPQFNIIDLQTGTVTGYRTDKNIHFSIFEEKHKELNIYYTAVQVDDNYIYALYSGTPKWGDYKIHIFDWEGNLLRKIHVGDIANMMWLDRVRNRLYVYKPETDGVFYLDLNDALLGL